MNVPLWLRLRASESEAASIRYFLHEAADAALAALVALVPPGEIEMPDMAIHNLAEDDPEYRRLRERARIAHDRVRDRVSTEVAEHLEEALRAERECVERAALLTYRMVLAVRSSPEDA